MSMSEIFDLDGFSLPSVNDVVTGTVVSIAPNEVTLDIGGATEGTIYLNELTDKDVNSANDVVEIGDEITVLVKKVSDEQILLSKKAMLDREKFEALKVAFSAGETVHGRVIKSVRGGLIVNIGVEAFMPARLADTRYVEDLNVFVGQDVRVKITEIKGNKITVSRKEIVAEEREIAKTAELTVLKVGDRVDAKVVRVTDFGAFIEFGALEGLVHISEVSHARTTKVSDELSVGDAVSAKITKIDGEKIGLSIKAAAPTPIEEFAQIHRAGDIVTGTVRQLTDFGAFITVGPMVEGLLHRSELSWGHNQGNISEFVTVGKKIGVKVIGIDIDNGKIALSLKQVDQDPFDALEFAAGDVVKGEVTDINKVGAFIKVAENIEGLCPFGEASWKQGGRLEDVANIGDTVDVRVVSIDKVRRRVGLSLRQVSSNPWTTLTFKEGDVITGTVASTTDRGAFIQVAEGVEGFLPINQIVERRISRVEEAISIGSEVEVKVMELKPNQFRMTLSMTRIATDAERNNFNDYMKKQHAEENDATQTLGDLFGDALKDFV